MTENSTGKPSPGNETITGKTVREEGCHLLPTEHERIWLEPAGAPDRCWCQDNVWGDEAVEYVRFDLITPAPAPHVVINEEDRTPVPEGYDATLWQKADEVCHAMALVADDTECVKIVYAALATTEGQP